MTNKRNQIVNKRRISFKLGRVANFRSLSIAYVVFGTTTSQNQNGDVLSKSYNINSIAEKR